MSRARVLADRANQNTLAVDTTNSEVGIASTVPNATLDVRGEVKVGTAVQLGSAGVVTATSFSGSGANLTGLATTETVRTDTLTVAGVSTLTGAVNVDATTDSTSTSTGALIVDGGVGIAKNVYIGAGLSVAGTLTYEDVTNVDSVGVVTAKSGVNVSGGQLQVGVAYSVGAAGVATAAGFVGGSISGTTGTFSEKTTVNATLEATEGLNVTAGVTTIGGQTNIGTGLTITTGAKAHWSGNGLIFDPAGVPANGGFTLKGHSNPTINVSLGATNSVQIRTNATGGLIRTTGAYPLIMGTNQNENLRITSGGDMGLGTDSPNSYSNQRVLTINGTTYGRLDLEVGGTLKGSVWGDSDGLGLDAGGNSIEMYAGSAERLRITSTGFVGVNETSPACQLHVEQDVAHASTFWLNSDAGILIDNKNSTANTPKRVLKLEGDAAIVYGSTDAGDLLFNQRENTVLTLAESRRVGVGTTNPSASLDLGAQNDSTPKLYVRNHTAAGAFNGNYGSEFRHAYGSINHCMLIHAEEAADSRRVLDISDSNGIFATFTHGKVGINTTTPDGKLEINASASTNMLMFSNSGSNFAKLGYNAASGVDILDIRSEGHTRFLTGGNNERLRITDGGGILFSNGELVERCNITAGKLSDNTNIDLEDGMVHYFTTQESTTSTPNIRVSSSTTLNSVMDAGDVCTVTLVTTAAAAGYSANMTIDGNSITEEWVGGSAPSAGGSDGLDVYSYTIICTHASNTGDSGFKVIANYINATN